MENNTNNTNNQNNTMNTKSFVSALLKMGFKQSKKATKIFAINQVQELDKSAIKLSSAEKESLSKMIEASTFTVYDGDYGFRVNMSYAYDGYKNSIWANIYDQRWQRDDFVAGEISDKDKERLVVIFYEKPNETSFAVVMMDEPVIDLADAANKLGL